MSWLSEFSTLFFSLVLALSNGAADVVNQLLPAEPETSFTAIDSDYQAHETIPEILLKNSSYQQASLISSQTGRYFEPSPIEDALVNIYCTQKTSEGIKTTTGSGFFIDPAGVIMTNAHVAQFLLLELVEDEVEAECIVRTGSPATAQYEANLLYISPAWIQKHAALIDAKNPKGTGERDFALLFISAGLENRPLPARFPSLLLNTSPLTPKDIGTTVTLGGYPAEAYIGSTTAKLYSATANSVVSDILTFSENTPDILAIAPSELGQSGVSGGPVVNESNEVIGLISTKGTESEGVTSLRALTISNIDTAIKEESTFTLAESITGQLALRAQLYTSTIATFLAKVLEAEL